MEKLVLMPVLVVGLLIAYFFYANWRDERLDAEDEKYDRIPGEKRT